MAKKQKKVKNKKHKKQKRMDRAERALITAVVLYAFVAGILIFLLKCIFLLSTVPSGSMEGTIPTGSVVLSERYRGEEKEIERYDIVVFTLPDNPEIIYIKRIIGLPGETIEVKDGKVYANGVELDNTFVNGTQSRKGSGVYTVPAGCYFALGDNRNNSWDSRFWKNKYVPLENIHAKAERILFPFTNAGLL